MIRWLRVLAVTIVAVFTGSADASDIKIMSANVFTHVIEEVAKDFTSATGHKVTIDYYTIGEVRDRVQKGEVTDVVILTRLPTDGLLAQGRIAAGSILDIARSGVGMAVRKGAVKPEIVTVDAFKRTLLAAGTIAYPDPARGGASGILLVKIFERLGITEAMKPKTRHAPPGKFAAYLVARGEAELAMTQPMEFYAEPGVDFVGWLPEELQSQADFQFSASVHAAAKDAQAAKAFVQHLAGPTAAAIFRAKGMQAGQP
jgi:molybdate transport system substrate-binding protein